MTRRAVIVGSLVCCMVLGYFALQADHPVFGNIFFLYNPGLVVCILTGLYEPDGRVHPAFWLVAPLVNGLCYAVVFVPLALYLTRPWRRFRYPEGHCQQCGYDLTGNVSGVCPECGESI